MKTEAPLCECHGVQKRWYRDAARRSGGLWRCAEKHRENVRKWREKNPERQREINASRLRVCGMYIGKVGFTQKEREELLNGSSD